MIDNERLRLALATCSGLAEVASGYFLRRTLDGTMSKDWRETMEVISGFSRNATIADVGCGPGVFLLYLRDLGFRNLIASDVEQQKLEWCATLFDAFNEKRPKLLVGGCADPLDGHPVDVVTAFEWVYESEEFLGEMLNVNARVLFISLPTKIRMIRTRVQRSPGPWCNPSNAPDGPSHLLRTGEKKTQPQGW